MGEIVNLNKFRKGKARADRRRLVAVNRHKFARPRAEVERLDALRDRQEAALDSHLLDDEPDAIDLPGETDARGRDAKTSKDSE